MHYFKFVRYGYNVEFENQLDTFRAHNSCFQNKDIQPKNNIANQYNY